MRHPRLLALAVLALLAACFPARQAAVSPASDPSAVRVLRSVPIRDRFARGRLELLRAINGDRTAAGLRPLILDSLASHAAQRHAEAMAAERFFSHYDRAGRSPYERFAELGGTGHVLENVYQWRERDADPLLRDDPWERFDPRTAQAALMASPPHQAVILDPHRTSVGLGFAVDRERRAVFVVQEFVARHVELSTMDPPSQGAPARLEGRMLEPGLRPLLLVVRREPAARASRESDPPSGSYDDGGVEPKTLPPWAFDVLGGGAFAVDLEFDLLPGRYYAVLYVAPAHEVEIALARRRAYSGQGWPGAAIVFEVGAS